MSFLSNALSTCIILSRIIFCFHHTVKVLFLMNGRYEGIKAYKKQRHNIKRSESKIYIIWVKRYLVTCGINLSREKWGVLCL